MSFCIPNSKFSMDKYLSISIGRRKNLHICNPSSGLAMLMLVVMVVHSKVLSIIINIVKFIEHFFHGTKALYSKKLKCY